MKTPNMGRAAAVVALALGLAGGAYAQTQPPGGGMSTGTTIDSTGVGGTATDMTSAGNANGGGLPQIQHQGEVAFVSGGVGSDESAALKREAQQWPLSMRFTGPGSDYLADVHVRIVGSNDTSLLRADSRGPYMLVRLPPGHYTVRASYKDDEQTRQVTVSKIPGAHVDFHWDTQ